MKNQKYSKIFGFSHVLVLSIVGVVIILGALGYTYYRSASNKNITVDNLKLNSEMNPLNNVTKSQQEAIDAAKAYKTDDVCLAAMTKATHTETGAKYTFSSSCLAPGWVADTTPAKSVSQLQQEAIDAAKAYKTDDVCLAAMTKATHTETGAKYTFSSSCLAPGWVVDETSTSTPTSTSTTPKPTSTPTVSTSTPASVKSVSQLQQEAIDNAKAYRPSGTCFSALTKATHVATGAKYTFPSSCLAPGWAADIAPTKSLSQLQQEAIDNAKAYRPSGTCFSALTKATHVATGAKYTFPSSCLAPGWVADAVPAKSLTELRQEAINAAKAYRTSDICFMEMTPAVHAATGARYTFPSSCLAPGWNRI